MNQARKASRLFQDSCRPKYIFNKEVKRLMRVGMSKREAERLIRARNVD